MRYLADGNYIVVPDMQIPFHDVRLVRGFVNFVEDYEPDGLLCVGDESDSPEPSRWNKGMAGEYADTLEAGLQATYDVMRELALALNASGKGVKPFLLSRSNHGDRIQKYLSRYAPAMARTSWNQYSTILGYNMQRPMLAGREDPLPIDYHTKPIPIARGWVMMHGDEGNLIQSAGGTALSLAKKVGASVVCGHTHRAGIQHHNQGHSGRVTQRLVGLEVGHMMDMTKAGYLGTGSANWQQAFGILHIRKGVVFPQLALIEGRKIIVDGYEHAC